MKKPRILVFAGSIRAASHNARFAGTLTKALVFKEAEVTHISLRDYPMPLYNGDDEYENGPPDNAVKLARLFHSHDAVVIVSPEYNASFTPLLKNTIDWISRVKQDDKGDLNPYRHKVFAIASASPGKFAGMRSLIHLRATLVSTGALVLSEQVSVGGAGSAFDENDELLDERTRTMVDSFCNSVVEKAKLHPASL
ncbi:MAG: NADPH-dependent FMN reductase [Rhizobiaceae bacterium]